MKYRLVDNALRFVANNSFL